MTTMDESAQGGSAAAMACTDPARTRSLRATPPAGAGRRRRGRPPLMAPDQVLAHIRESDQAGTLFRVHLEQPALYARARRLWGSWAGALLAAGIDYEGVMSEARRKSADSRRRIPGDRRPS